MVAVSCSLLLAFFAIEHFHSLHYQQLRQQQLSQAQTQLVKFRANLEAELNAALYASWGLVNYLTLNPRTSPQQWQPLAQGIIENHQNIRNLAIAPDNIVRFVYPLAGNEAVLGVDYSKIPEQFAMIDAARQQRQMLIAGPVDLVQGGRGVIARIPVFYRAEDGTGEQYWGSVAVVLDLDQLLQRQQLTELTAQYKIAMRGTDGKGASGDIFMGSEAIYAQADFYDAVQFLNGSWSIAIQLDSQQLGSVWQQQRVRLIGYPYVTALFLMLMALFRWYRRTYQEAMLDPLTGVANRRALDERMQVLMQVYERHQIKFAVIVVDLNGFKYVNDSFGHHAGDLVLQHTAQRLLVNTRATDTVARLGGDEFVLVLMGIDNERVVSRQVDKLRAALNQPVVVKEQQIAVSASLGCALFPMHGQTVEALLQHADIQMYKNKRKE
ncbi:MULTISPECIES: diguanylate cyclase domain-containing protein [Idiomarina]|nr:MULTISPECIES: diguanylate cyclase [Idiomarina]NCU59513.1 diguanylate cyclase [Idiomarina sp. FenBw--71]UUN14171.1 sensor domain-containing diguanylate cyclase [Idiomarina loihiensis]